MRDRQDLKFEKMTNTKFKKLWKKIYLLMHRNVIIVNVTTLVSITLRLQTINRECVVVCVAKKYVGSERPNVRTRKLHTYCACEAANGPITATYHASQQ